VSPVRGPARAVALLGLLVAGTPGCAALGSWLSTPARPFGAYTPPPAPDFASPESWAALPWRDSPARDLPRGVAESASRSAVLVDVFFLHPTTYFGRKGWNARIDAPLIRLMVDATLAGQASAFNDAGQIYAPRYRQMTLSGFRDATVRDRGLDLAYADVRAAFAYYLEHYNRGRPILLAGHSQGSRLLLRLLEEFFVDAPLRDRLVAAYPVGARVWTGPYRRGGSAIPICRDALQTGCLVSWRTFAEGADPSLDDNPGEPADGLSLCVNPLSWRFDDAPMAASANLGSIPIPFVGPPAHPEPGLVGARCEAGYLWIDPPRGCGYRIAHGDGNYHAYDYALYYMNVRRNAAARSAAFLRAAGHSAFAGVRASAAPGRAGGRLCSLPYAEAASRVRGRVPRQRRSAPCGY